MKVTIDARSVLTTEHPASSFGIPVLLIDGVAYGPHDNIPSDLAPVTASDALRHFAQHGQRLARGNKWSEMEIVPATPEQREAIQAFLLGNAGEAVDRYYCF